MIFVPLGLDLQLPGRIRQLVLHLPPKDHLTAGQACPLVRLVPAKHQGGQEPVGVKGAVVPCAVPDHRFGRLHSPLGPLVAVGVEGGGDPVPDTKLGQQRLQLSALVSCVSVRGKLINRTP